MKIKFNADFELWATYKLMPKGATGSQAGILKVIGNGKTAILFAKSVTTGDEYQIEAKSTFVGEKDVDPSQIELAAITGDKHYVVEV